VLSVAVSRASYDAEILKSAIANRDDQFPTDSELNAKLVGNVGSRCGHYYCVVRRFVAVADSSVPDDGGDIVYAHLQESLTCFFGKSPDSFDRPDMFRNARKYSRSVARSGSNFEDLRMTIQARLFSHERNDVWL